MNSLSAELIVNIFSYLDYHSFADVCLVSQLWKACADVFLPKKMAYDTYAFGKRKWEKISGESYEENDFSALRSDIVRILNSPCPLFKDKLVKETHLLMWIPKGQSLDKLGKIAKTYFPNTSVTGYKLLTPGASELAEQPCSQWILMTIDAIPGSYLKKYQDQEKMIAAFSYAIPRALQMVSALFAKYSETRIRLFADNPWKYTYCADQVNGKHLIVGGFTSEGLHISSLDQPHEGVGMAALRVL